MSKWENSTDQILQHVKQLLEQLPLEVQQAFNLLINNLDIIDELLCDAMTLETKKSYVEDALQREDYLLAMIVEYKWLEQERKKE